MNVARELVEGKECVKLVRFVTAQQQIMELSRWSRLNMRLMMLECRAQNIFGIVEKPVRTEIHKDLHGTVVFEFWFEIDEFMDVMPYEDCQHVKLKGPSFSTWLEAEILSLEEALTWRPIPTNIRR